MKHEGLTINGVTLEDGSKNDRAESKTLGLPSGRSASIRKGFGRDLMRAQRVAGPTADPAAVVFALIAELVEIDGGRVMYEDVLGMDLGDVLVLQAEVAGANFQDPPPAHSRPLSTSDSQ